VFRKTFGRPDALTKIQDNQELVARVSEMLPVVNCIVQVTESGSAADSIHLTQEEVNRYRPILDRLKRMIMRMLSKKRQALAAKRPLETDPGSSAGDEERRKLMAVEGASKPVAMPSESHRNTSAPPAAVDPWGALYACLRCSCTPSRDIEGLWRRRTQALFNVRARLQPPLRQIAATLVHQPPPPSARPSSAAACTVGSDAWCTETTTMLPDFSKITMQSATGGPHRLDATWKDSVVVSLFLSETAGSVDTGLQSVALLRPAEVPSAPRMDPGESQGRTSPAWVQSNSPLFRQLSSLLSQRFLYGGPARLGKEAVGRAILHLLWVASSVFHLSSLSPADSGDRFRLPLAAGTMGARKVPGASGLHLESGVEEVVTALLQLFVFHA